MLVSKSYPQPWIHATIHEQSMNHILLKKRQVLDIMLCAEYALANTRRHQLCWVTRRWRLPLHARKIVKWLALSHNSALFADI